MQQAAERGFATGGQRPGPGPADHHTVGTQRERAEHIHAAADAAIHQNLGLPADGRDNAGQFAGRCSNTIELTAAVVGHHDAICTAGDGIAGIVGIQNAFQQQLAAPLAAQPGDVVPGNGRVELSIHPGFERIQTARTGHRVAEVAEGERFTANGHVQQPAGTAEHLLRFQCHAAQTAGGQTVAGIAVTHTGHG